MSKSQELFEREIVGIEEISPNFYIIDLKFEFEFTAGQVVAITTSKELEPRLYSIAGSFNRGTIRILFDIHKEGALTPILAERKVGTTINVSKPFGRFLGSDDAAWLIATGTGIAPYMAMCQKLNTSNKVIIHGARKRDGFLFESFFDSILKENYIRCCSTESGDGIYNGRLTKWLTNQENLPLDIKYYLCGNPEMVVEVRDILVNKGVDYKNIISEIYF